MAMNLTHEVVKAILDELSRRKGIDYALDEIDEEIWTEDVLPALHARVQKVFDRCH